MPAIVINAMTTPRAGRYRGSDESKYVYGVQIDAAFPTLFMNAIAAARFDGGRGIELAIQAYICSKLG